MFCPTVGAGFVDSTLEQDPTFKVTLAPVSCFTVNLFELTLTICPLPETAGDV